MKMSRLTIGCLLIFSLTGILGTASADPLVVNGEFSDGLTGWTVSGGNVTTEIDSLRLYGGATSFPAWSPSSSFAYQIIHLLPQHAYALEMDLDGSGISDPFKVLLSGVTAPPGSFPCGVSTCFYGDRRPFFEVLVDGALIYRFDGIPAASHLELAFTATTIDTQITLRSATGPGYFQIDNIRVEAVTTVSEPTDIIAFFVFVFMISVLERRQRRVDWILCLPASRNLFRMRIQQTLTSRPAGIPVISGWR